MKPFEKLSYAGQGRRLRHLAEIALARYDLGNAQLSLLSHRFDTTFRVEVPPTGKQIGEKNACFVLRVHGPGGPGRAMIESERFWLAALRRETELVVPDPIATKDGSLVIEVAVAGIPEARHCTLSSWVDGRFVGSGLTPTLFEQVGTFMARLHRQAEHFLPPPGFVRPHRDLLVVFDDLRLLSKGKGSEFISESALAVIGAAAERVRGTIQALPQTPESYGMIHGDIQSTNYLFHKRQVRVIDFEDCCRYYYLYDITHTLSEVESRPDRTIMREAFFRGYERIRPLPTQYEEIIKMFMAIRLVKRVNYLVSTSDNPAHRALAPEWIAYTVDWLRQFLQQS